MIVRAVVLSVGIVACTARPPRLDTTAAPGVERLTFEVRPARVPCTGEARTRCLVVRVLPDTTWRFFYDSIDGFTFKEGYRWRLEVDRRRVPNPRADGSSAVYRLVRVVSKKREIAFLPTRLHLGLHTQLGYAQVRQRAGAHSVDGEDVVRSQFVAFSFSRP